jgi:cytochrome oxidase Cu insertion factor (SCO1/SenC/PrrC family)
MSFPKRLAAVAAVMLFAAPAARLAAEEKLASDEQPGLNVGENAPRFTLKDQQNKERSLDEFLRKGKVALVFYRSADW